MEHLFTQYIKDILAKQFDKQADAIFTKSPILQYLNIKTKSAQRGSKSRASFANLYAIYVLVEDYINEGYLCSGNYAKYEGALFTDLLKRTRELPFGAKLQNHALNSRMNEEFKKYFPECESAPIIRDLQNNRYWINEYLLKIKIGRKTYNIAKSIINIIDEYARVKSESFQRFIEQCQELENIENKDVKKIKNFIISLLAPNVDARLFEIVSFSILKYYYKDEKIYWGYSLEDINEDYLRLYKIGRTNANDGGIDFVMKPLGRFFQVTETLDFKKYFLDIDKIERYPITFVVKSEDEDGVLRAKLKESAKKTYSVETIVDKYLASIEELINIPKLKSIFESLCAQGNLSFILREILLQSKVEFNYDDDE